MFIFKSIKFQFILLVDNYFPKSSLYEESSSRQFPAAKHNGRIILEKLQLQNCY